MRQRTAAWLLGALLLASAAAGAAEFWDKKKFTQWSKKDVEKMLSNSPWTEDFEDTDVNIDPLQSPALSSGPPLNETGTGAPPTDDTDVGLRARQAVARLIYNFQIRSALPVRQALVRRAQLQQDYERMPAEQRQVFDQQADRFLEEDFAEEQFFQVTGSGGTVASSAFRLALEVLRKRYDPARYNGYLFYASDGENTADDLQSAAEALAELAAGLNYAGYVEIGAAGARLAKTQIAELYEELRGKGLPVGSASIAREDDVWGAIRDFFRGQAGVEATT